MLLAAALFAAGMLPQAPDPTLPPAGVKAVTTVDARGVQIYLCAPQGGSFKWVFQGPEATLFDPSTHQQVGTHSAGPAWTWTDGSTIEGKVVKQQPSPDVKDAIPWLLVETHNTGTGTGMLSGVTYVRRSNTQAGAAPATGCDAQNVGITIRVPYVATYTFYKKAQ